MPSFQLRGVADMQRKIKSIAVETRRNIVTAAVDEAESVASNARNLVPIESGKLESSIRVDKSELTQGRSAGGQFTSGSVVEVKVSAGGDDLPYALAVHENPSRYDPPSWQGVDVQFKPAGRGPKFLERPLRDSERGMARRIADKVRLG